MTSKLHWGVACLLAVFGCQSGSPPNMTLLEGPMVEPEVATLLSAAGVGEPGEPMAASFRAEPAPSDRAIVPSRSEAIAFPATAGPAARNPVTKADVVAWTSRGVPDEVIIERIAKSRTVFHLTAADQNELQDKGVSKPVIRAMRETWRR